MKYFFRIISIASILISSTALASQNGYYYVGADAGVFSGDFNNNYLDQTDMVAQNIVQPAEQHAYTGGVAIGYRYLLCPLYYLGAELSDHFQGHYASFQSGSSTTAFSDQTQLINNVDLLFVPGIKLNDTSSTYLKLGLSYAMLRDSLVSPAGFSPTFTTYNNKQNKLGFAAGLGFEKQVTNQVSLFAEANYHDYGSVSFSSFENFAATYQHTTHVYTYSAVVGARWKIMS